MYHCKCRMKTRSSEFVLTAALLLGAVVGVCYSGFTQSYYGHREAEDDEIPQGAATLAFVFDITGSMYDDLVQVIEGAARILNTILARREKAIYNYVLVPFHDPDVGPVTITSDPDLFQRHLKELYVQGGGDCPEMSVGAIKLALEVCLPNSHIYVFTDARAKDYYLLNDVLKLIQRKESQVVFVLTGDCGNHTHPGYQAYERIASTSSGQVFHLRKSDVDEVLNFVRVSLQARKVNLLAVDRNVGDMKEFPFHVDDSLRDFTLSVAGENPIIHIYDPKGELIDEDRGLIELLSHRNISIVNIKDPVRGQWKLIVQSEGPHTIRATGLSKIDFVHGFSRQPTANMRETYHRPLKGAPTYLLVNATDLQEPGTFDSVKLIDLEGNNLQNIPLYRFPDTNLFNASTFYPPDEYFYLKVSGFDELGYPLERITSTAISAQLPDAPEVNTRPRINGYYEEEVELKCYIQSLVPFTVVWYKEGIQISQEQHFLQTTEITLTIPEVDILSEGWYTCNASNIAGSSSSAIFLDVKEPPPDISKPGNVSGIIGRQAVLPCNVHSVVDHNITWVRIVGDQFRKGYVKLVPIPDIARIMVHSNDSLVINGISKEDEGWYRCIAANEGGSSHENLYLYAYYPPEINVRPQIRSFTAGESINITCEAEGYPPPDIRWLWSPKHEEAFSTGRNKVERGYLFIYEADPNDEGRYDCMATNIAGSKGQSSILNYIEAPVITVAEDNLLVGNGDQATLRCIVEGIPPPKVTWYKEGYELHPLSYIHMSSDGLLTVFGVQELDAGSYTCVATNEAGSSEETLFLSVGSMPSMIQLPSDVSIEVTHSGSIPCIATGFPKPEISWKYENGSSIQSNPKLSVSPDGDLLVYVADISEQRGYICRAENRFGFAEHKVNLHVTGIIKPVISPLPSIMNVKKNNAVNLECAVVDGNPKPKIQWFQNGRNIETGGDLEVDEQSTLVIQRVNELHEAYYSCIATNVGGNASQETYLNVQVAPLISNDSQEFSAIEGSSVILPCSVEGDPKPFITWQKNNILLDPNDDTHSVGDDGNLILYSVVEENSGIYTCVAVNIIGTTKRELFLSVHVPPRITQQKKNYEAVEGNVVTLPCVSHAVPPATIKWQREVSGSQDIGLEQFTLSSGSLQFVAKLSDAGNYTCEAENFISKTVETVTLLVFVPPKIIAKDPMTHVVGQGNEAYLACEAVGHPVPTISWSKDSQVINSSSSYTILEDGLYFPSVSILDGGQYVCIAENHVGSAHHAQNLVVHVPPEIHSVMEQDLSVTEGNQISIPCKAEGFPQPSIIWKKNDQTPVGFHHVQNGTTLYIQRAHVDDAGVYSCVAENVAGSDTLTFNVSVFVPPSLESREPHTAVKVIEGRSVTLDCSVSAFPPPEIIWHKNDEVFIHSNMETEDNGQKLKLASIDRSASGTYTCFVRNVAGEISKQYEVDVLANNLELSLDGKLLGQKWGDMGFFPAPECLNFQVLWGVGHMDEIPPSFISDYERNVFVQEDQQLSLDCTTYGNPKPHLFWKRNNQPISALTMPDVQMTVLNSQLRINYTRRSDAGIYSCTAVNSVGSSEREFDVSVLVPPYIHGENFQEKETLVFEPMHLICSSSGIPHPQISWYKNGTLFYPGELDKVNVADSGQKLEFWEPTLNETGLYTCIARNEVGQARKDINLFMLDPPHIKDQSVVDVSRVKEGEDVLLECEAYGNPQPQVIWKKDNKLLSRYETSDISFLKNGTQLKLDKIKAEDQGKYTCIVTSKIGSAEKDFIVDVLTQPKLADSLIPSNKGTKKDDVLEVLETHSVRLSCPASGNPPPEITWLKDTQPLQYVMRPGISILDNGRQLYIDHSLAEDFGTYTCRAINEVGETEKEFNLNILVPPRMLDAESPVGVEVPENDTLILNCSVKGNPLPKIMWLKDGYDFQFDSDVQFSSDKTSVTFPNIKGYDAGKYTCIATSIAGSSEKEFNVDVLVAPFLEIPSYEVEFESRVVVNKPVTLRCPISGNPEPEIVWLKHGRFLEHAKDANVYIHPSGKKLSVLRAKLTDAGHYSCVAKNSVGEKILDFNLEVWVSPMIDHKKFKTNYSVKEGDSLTVECPVSGNPKPFITWLKGSQEIFPEFSFPHIRFSEDFQSMHIVHTTLKDIGKYTCVARNQVGVAEQDFKVDVLVPPKLDHVKNVKDTHSAVINKPVTILCPVSGVPPPAVKWFKNNKLLNPYADANVALSTDGRQLKIFRVRTSDAANYTCRAVNEAGKIEKEFTLSVQVPPRFVEANFISDTFPEETDGSQVHRVIENDTVQMECHVDGDPEPVIFWLKDGHLIHHFDGNSPYRLLYKGQELQIIGADVSNSGHYTCIASNVAGTNEKEFTLEVLVPPKIKNQEEVLEALTSRPLSIECAVESQPPARITWLKDNEAIDYAKHSLIQILDEGKILKLLKPNSSDQGRFTCVAENDAGKTEKHFDLDIHVPPVIKPSDVDVSVAENGNISLECNVSGNPIPKLIWLKDGELISDSKEKELQILFEEEKQILIIPHSESQHNGKYKCMASNNAGSTQQDFDVSVKVPPKIINSSNPLLSILAHTPLDLICIIEAKPPTSITWFKNGKVVNHLSDPFINIFDRGQKLQILRSRETDIGNYSCEANNTIGTTRKTFAVDILVPPRIKNVLQEESQLVAVEGNVTELECLVYGNPDPSISWLKDGKVLHTDKAKRVRLLKNNQLLQIFNVEVEDGGHYTCAASSSLGTQIKHFDLLVHVPPKISDELNTEPVAVLNQPLRVYCEAIGNPKPHISWMKNGMIIDPFSDPNLHILTEESALLIRWSRIGDAGKYTCIASSLAGQDEKDFDIKVHTPALIEKVNFTPLMTAISNHPITLECPVSGIPFPRISWIKDGDPINQATFNSSFQVLEGGQKLRIVSAKPSDAGKYQCIAFNDAGTDEISIHLDVLVPPELNETQMEEHNKVLEGENVVIVCPVQNSDYPPTITWMKDSEFINSNKISPHFDFSDDYKTLKIMKAQSEDSGVYKCLASNPAGEAEFESHLLVIVPAKVIHPVESNTHTFVKEQQSVTLECIVGGNPHPIVDWFKDGKPILEEQDTVFPGHGKLRLINATVQDAGLYLCLTSNEGGIDERSYNLSVFVPPAINISAVDSNQAALQHSDVSFHCPSIGYPFPRIIWYKNSQMLIPGTKVSFSADGMNISVHQLTVADAGKYTCMALNEVGESEMEHFLKVLVPPSIEQITIQGQPVADHPVRIVCEAKGLPSPNITWFKNGSPMKEPHENFSFAGGGRYLDFPRLLSFDSAIYTCFAKNNAGSSKKDVSLQVMVPPEINSTAELENYDVIIGKPIRIKCPASGIPPPTISWLKNGLPLPEQDHIHLLDNDYVLWFASAMIADGGTYTCIASNSAGSVEQNFTLSVLVPPTIVNSFDKKNLSVIIGHELQIQCLVSGVPEPDIIWVKDDQILSSDEDLNVDKQVLKIHSVELHHDGEYVCEASNVAGKTTKSRKVHVMVPPSITGSGSSTFIASLAKDPTVIECHVSGVPVPALRWLKDGIPIFSESNSNIEIRKNGTELVMYHSQRTDSGSYTCLASNSAGNASKNVALNVLEPPTIKSTSRRKRSVIGEQTTLECGADGVPVPEISWLKNGAPVSSLSMQYSIKPSGFLILPNVRLQDSGNYTCIATNEAGSAEKNIALDILAPPSIAKAPDHVKVFSGESANLICEATGLPDPIVMWHKDSSLIHNNSVNMIMPDGTLHIPVSMKENSGTYTCVAENDAGSQQVSRHLEVLNAPHIKDTFQNEYIKSQGQNVVLKCEAEGLPSPRLFWERNGISLDFTDPRYKVLDSGSLYISLVQPWDMGTYSCIAKNEAGSDTKTTELVVHVPPSIVKDEPSVLTTVKGRSIEIPCHSEGFPPPHISWQHDGEAIPPSFVVQHTGSLVLSNVQPENGGEYVCIAINSAGRDFKEVKVQVHVPPAITTFPKSQDISVGDTISLSCEADGIPTPVVTWLLNNTQLTGITSSEGHSQLVIDNARKEDQGSYICLMQNAAGERKAVAAVRVRAPPVVIDSPGVQEVRLQEAVMLDCSVNGDPFPNIIWIKNGQKLELNHRIQQTRNGSLLIYNSLDRCELEISKSGKQIIMHIVLNIIPVTVSIVYEDEDSGQYKCIASNDFGSAEGTAELVIRSEPKFVIEPYSTTTELGGNVNMDCKVTGEPEPSVLWLKDKLQLNNSDRLFIMPNNSLRIVAVQPSDEGVYSCIAENSLGIVSAEAQITVQVHGMWSQWQEWGPCASSCGQGLQLRKRMCDSPEPRNGGKTCMGVSMESRFCKEHPCPIAGEWGNWLPWSECSSTCGAGYKQHFRNCDNPAPQYGGKDCVGHDNETESCILKKCPVDGGWSIWSSWHPCSVTCGEGVQKRSRECNDPEPSHGGLNCYGENSEEQVCNLRECEIHGEWGEWNEWSLCSSSCGGGTRERKRSCDSPSPAFGGHMCSGLDIQVDYCNNYACPVNGEWSLWSSWGGCSASCDTGQRKRFRSCDNPAPSNGGRDCYGPSQEMENCNTHLCPVHGKWSEWDMWSECSSSCGIGTRSRSRECDIPAPSEDIAECFGESIQFEECGEEACDIEPVQAIGHIIGAINGIDFGLSKINANISRLGMEQTVVSSIENIPQEVGVWMKILVPLITPIYWTTAHEIGKAVNGYTLTKGFFRKESQVGFATGEKLHITHVARGLDKRGNLLVDIVITGEVPIIPIHANIIIHPFTEDYVQMGPGSLYAFSTRTYQLNQYVLPYMWNHSIVYDENLDKMPYVVQRLYANTVDSSYDADRNEINYVISTAIGKGVPEDQCPEGYEINNDGPYCKDLDECEQSSLCSHHCVNTLGSYSCLCPIGLTLNLDGHTCDDVNECLMKTDACEPNYECLNTDGSFKCLILCKKGFVRTYDDLFCKDVNECEVTPDICSHQCFNTIGSYYCTCEGGYHLVGKSSCLDIDECNQENPPCSHMCANLPGSYQCFCPDGYEMGTENVCYDIDECELGSFSCLESQECVNIDGGFKCVLICPKGFIKAENDSCIDVDECDSNPLACHFSQICINTHGSYYCTCPQGYYTEGPGKPCQDVNECLQNPRPCIYRCINLRGDYQCVCPPGQKRLTDGKTCAGLEYLENDSPRIQDDYFSTHQNQTGQYVLGAAQSSTRLYTYDCPVGFVKIAEVCQDIDECEAIGTCQHLCENTVGSYRCSCPTGYKLVSSGKSCQDIDECLELNIKCGPEKMCFNTRGSFECISTPCPPKYDRDLVNGYCRLECEKAGIVCPPNIKYAEILAFKMVALPSGIQAYQDLVRLAAYDQDGVHLPNTVFTIIENDTGVPFRIRLENGKGILFTQKDMESNREYQIKVKAVSYDNDTHTVQYTTKFLVFVSVSKYPY